MTNRCTVETLLSLSLFLTACGGTPAAPSTQPPAAAASQSGAQTVETKASLEAKAATGDKNAEFELGALYHDGEKGTTKDFVKAKRWFEGAAAQGEVRAEFNLGVMYYTGEGVKQNFALAKQWFDKAVAQNNSRAQFNLGVMYYRGEGVKIDLAKAYDLFQKAAVQNFAEAQFNLAVMEAKGEGKEADIGMAYAWFVLARENGNPRADEIIKNIERELKPDQKKIVDGIVTDLRTRVQASVKTTAAK